MHILKTHSDMYTNLIKVGSAWKSFIRYISSLCNDRYGLEITLVGTSSEIELSWIIFLYVEVNVVVSSGFNCNYFVGNP